MAKLINPYTECGLPRHLPPRWHVALVYRTRSGLLEIEHDIEELFELGTWSSMARTGTH